MYLLLESVCGTTGVTTLHITHNRSEAKRLADVVLLLEHGTIRQLSPEERGEPEGTARENPKRDL
jgi:ABC-type sulfate/molybdate transport systems ATPase subunit